MGRQRMRPIAERFWSKVDRDGPVPVHQPDLGPCWRWTGSVSGRYGHGEIGAGRRGEGNRKAHRVSWEIHRGPIPEGVQVLHRCDNGLCVNPEHLRLGTQGDNMRDMSAKGRHRNQNSDKTHCKRGHLLEGENLYMAPRSTARQCKTCKAARDGKAVPQCVAA
jgi:hypothetical protein